MPSLARVTIYPGILTAYPNFIFRIDEKDVEEFAAKLIDADTPEKFTAVVRALGRAALEPRVLGGCAQHHRLRPTHEPTGGGGVRREPVQEPVIPEEAGSERRSIGVRPTVVCKAHTTTRRSTRWQGSEDEGC